MCTEELAIGVLNTFPASKSIINILTFAKLKRIGLKNQVNHYYNNGQTLRRGHSPLYYRT
jgi:hypothetical protein